MVRFIEQHPERMVGYDSLFWYWTYLSNFAVSLKQTWTYQSDYLALNHFWSLAIEEQFYLVWPLLIYFGTRRQLVWILLGLLMVATPARYLADHFYGPWSLASTLMTPCRLDALAAGSLLALAVQSPRAQPWLSSKPLLYGTMGLLSAATLYFVLAGGPHFKSTVYSLFFAVAILIALQDRGWIQAALSHPFLLEMGKYSYALYIFHHLFKPAYLRLFGYMLFGMMPEWIAQVLYMAITFTITYGLSLLSWRCIEQPVLRLKDRFPY
jgi:peptidoglycan/LPS O-acetylase OafA/YrhL